MELRLGFIQNNSIHLDKELTPEEYTLFIEGISELHNYENLKRLYEIVVFNYNEFFLYNESKKKALIEDCLSFTGNKKEYYDHHLNLNRLLLNYLSSFRTFIDHSETVIKRKFGKDSEETKTFKETTSKLYDNYFSYRFFHKLRNYSQHCELPISDFEISATNIGENKFKTKYRIDFISSELLSKYTEWGPVKKDLENQETFSIFPLMDEMSAALNQLWLSLISIFENNILNAMSFINLNSSHLKDEDSSVCLFTDIKTNEHGHVEYYTSQTIPFDIIEELAIKN